MNFHFLKRFITQIENALQVSFLNVPKFKKFLVWLVYDFSGIRLIIEKIWPPHRHKFNQPASSFFLWVIGIYFTIYTISLNQFESSVRFIEYRANNIILSLPTKLCKSALSEIGPVQSMNCPIKPEFFKPIKTFSSFLGKDTVHVEIVDLLKQKMVFWKDSLSGLYLQSVDLSGTNLEGINLSKTTITHSNFENTILEECKFYRTYIINSNFKGAKMTKASLKDCHINESIFTYVDFDSSSIINTYFDDTKLNHANFLNVSYDYFVTNRADIRNTIFNDSIHENIKNKYSYYYPEMISFVINFNRKYSVFEDLRVKENPSPIDLDEKPLDTTELSTNQKSSR